jgi:polyhydroxyalkanoate synthesis regulator phasin
MANDEGDKPEKGEPRDPKVTEVLKKILTTGIGAAFMTEEHIRGYVTDLKLPKDVVQFLLQGATKSKEELMNKVGNEVIKIVQKIDIVKEASRFVEEHKFRVTAEIDVIKKNPVSVDISKDPK